jgi:hypothetical protein
VSRLHEAVVLYLQISSFASQISKRIELILNFSCSQQKTNDNQQNGHGKVDDSSDMLEAWLASGLKAGPWNAIGYY